MSNQYTITDPTERTYLLGDLTLVGPMKAIGYLPMRTVTRILQADIRELISTAASQGVSALPLKAKDCCIGGGALYLYHSETLQALLDASSDVLESAGVPTEPEAFVRYIAQVWFESDHPVLPIIKAAFADKMMSQRPSPWRRESET